jgi:hypothetical protein
VRGFFRFLSRRHDIEITAVRLVSTARARPALPRALTIAQATDVTDHVGNVSDDPAIQADLARTMGRDLPMVKEAIAAIVAKSGGAFAALDQDRREALINDYHASRSAPAITLGRVILGAYYRDDRVLAALGVEPRAPFPKGFTVEQGDWSLLDAVRNRPQLWRDDR